MPLDAQHGWRRTDMVSADEILTRLADEFSLAPDDPDGRGSAPAEMFLVAGGPGRFGVIGSVTRPFCGTCDRVRLTADGQVRNCLFATTETDLRTLLRAGATDDQLAPGAAASPPSCPATASTTRGACSPSGPCPPSAADRPRRVAGPRQRVSCSWGSRRRHWWL
jgi:molybdenum cofactor biosynthesis enzyme MoaA